MQAKWLVLNGLFFYLADQACLSYKWEGFPEWTLSPHRSRHIGNMPSPYCSISICGACFLLLPLSINCLLIIMSKILWLNFCILGDGWVRTFTDLSVVEISKEQKLCRWAVKLWHSDGSKFCKLPYCFVSFIWGNKILNIKGVGYWTALL